MSDERVREKEWLDYIVRLNQRSYSRKNVSGFTTWAILGALAILVKNTFEVLPLYLRNPVHANYLLVLTCVVLNIGIVIFMLFSTSLISTIDIRDVRLKSKMNRQYSSIALIPYYFINILDIFLNYYVISNKVYTAWRYPFYAFFVFAILQSLSQILQWLISDRKQRKIFSNDLLPQLQYKIPLITNKNLFVNSSLVFHCVLLLISIIPIYSSWRLVGTDLFFPLLNVSLSITSILILGYLLIIVMSSSIETSWLEKLERRIIIEQLDEIQIREAFIHEYLGETADEWLKNMVDTLSQKSSELIKAFEEADIALDKADEELKRYNDICNGLDITDETIVAPINEISETAIELGSIALEKFKRYAEVSEYYIYSLEHLIDQGAKYATDEELLKLVFKEWREQSKSIKEISTLYSDKSREFIAKREAIK